MSFSGLTRGAIIGRIQQNLFDATGTFFGPPDIAESIQDGYDDLALFTECIESTINIPFASNTIYYDLYNIIPGFYRVTKLFNKSTNRWLRVVDSRVLDKFRYDWELASGTPWFAYIVNFQWLGFFPHYSNPVGSFDVFYKIGKDTLVDDNSIPQIAPPFNRSVEVYGTADMLEQCREFKKTIKYWDEYELLRAKLRDQTMSRMSPDRLLQYNDLDDFSRPL